MNILVLSEIDRIKIVIWSKPGGKTFEVSVPLSTAKVLLRQLSKRIPEAEIQTAHHFKKSGLHVQPHPLPPSTQSTLL